MTQLPSHLTAIPRLTKRLLIATVLLIPLLVLANVSAGYYIDARYGPDMVQFRRSRPAGYAQSPFYSTAFIEEQTAVSLSWQAGNTWSGWDSNFHGRYFNTEKGMRRTALQPPDARHTVWMFGNSTLFGYEVPDELTIPSQLQRLLNTAYGTRYRVVNLGQTGMGIPQNLKLLKLLPIQPGDMVIGYDGLSEGFTLRLSETSRRELTVAGQVCNWLTTSPVKQWQLVELYCLWSDTILPTAIIDPIQPTLDQAEQMVETSITETYYYCATHGAHYYHFLPPHIWSKTPSAYEQAILNNPRLTPPGTAQSFLLMWPTLQHARTVSQRRDSVLRFDAYSGWRQGRGAGTLSRLYPHQ